MRKIIAVDFDGTLCLNNYPKIGKPIMPNIRKVKQFQREGCILILWTCRRGKELAEAIEWCKSMHNIEFDYINENAKESLEAFGGDTRKVYANMYFDDSAHNPNWD